MAGSSDRPAAVYVHRDLNDVSPVVRRLFLRAARTVIRGFGKGAKDQGA
jgi:hypothetical protein